MKALFLTETLVFYLIPRIYPLSTDPVTLSLTNEQTGEVLNPSITFVVAEKLSITITTQPTQFRSLDKYDITVKNGETVIYLGKMIILDSGTDIQNYKTSSQQNGRFKYK